MLLSILRYNRMSFSSLASYKSVTKHIERAATGDEVLITCQSEGYPKSTVEWQNGNLKTLNPNTTAESTPDQIFRITSQIKVSSSEKNNYTCKFTKDGSSATIYIPGKRSFPVLKWYMVFTCPPACAWELDAAYSCAFEIKRRASFQEGVAEVDFFQNNTHNI